MHNGVRVRTNTYITVWCFPDLACLVAGEWWSVGQFECGRRAECCLQHQLVEAWLEIKTLDKSIASSLLKHSDHFWSNFSSLLSL